MIRAVPLKNVKSVGGFWGKYQDALATEGLLHQWDQIVTTGRLENFHRAARGESGTFTGFRFNDSDIYKWLEAAAYSQALRPNAKVADAITQAIEAIKVAQRPDGYINTYVQVNRPGWQWANLTHNHEMYCIGHLVEASVALKEAINDERLMPIAERAVGCIMDTFGPGKRVGSCGHPEIELALYRLFQTTGKKAYAELADWMLDCRGQRPSPFEKEFETPETNIGVSLSVALEWKKGYYDGSYLQDDKPIREQDTIVGHSVRAAYLYAAAQWSAARRSDHELQSAIDRIWENLTTRKMYVTGGIGSTGDNEGFTGDYDLPNLNAYAETCAGIALAMWAKRGFEAQATTDPLDVLERTIFNGVLSGISLDSKSFYYDNVLEARGNKEREPWLGCACCPPNIARLIASITEYTLFTDKTTLYVGFPIDCEFSLDNGLSVKIESEYPHRGTAKIHITAAKPTRFRIALRLPDWADEVSTELPGAQPAEYENGFAVFDEVWEGTRTLSLEFEMQPRVISAHPEVLDSLGRVAIQYGPTIYCAESLNPAEAPQRYLVDLEEEITLGSKRTPFGAPTLRVAALRERSSQSELYEEATDLTHQSAEMNLIPYREWANSGASYMQVWLRN